MAGAKDCPLCTFPNPVGATRCACGFDFADWERRGRPQVCQGCGAEAETRSVTFHQHIGAVVYMFHSTAGGRFCKSCVHEQFLTKTAITGLLGWWGLISFCVTPFVLLINVSSYLFCLRMAPRPGPATGRQGVHGPASGPVARPGQLVGQNCAICGGRIPSVVDGGFCRTCHAPVHNGCVRPGEGTGCRTCGAANPAG